MTEKGGSDVRSVGFLLFPGMLQLDFTGPYGVLGQVPGVTVQLIAKTREAVVSSDGLVFQPTVDFASCPVIDILVVPGGGGVAALMEDGETLAFIRSVAGGARYVTSVCTGALVLGAAGLLRGRRATTHWQSFDLLSLFGAEAVRERVVMDGAVVTAAGVTSGIDMALSLVGRIWGAEVAQSIQLSMEYAPAPPFDSGSPDTAPDGIRQAVVERGAKRQAERREVALAAARRLEAEDGSKE